MTTENPTTAQPDTVAGVASADAAAPANPADAAPAADPNTTPATADTPAPDAGKADDTPRGAPEAYADFSFPEGFEADAELMAEFTPLAKEAGLSQEAAQKLVDMSTKLMTKAQDAQRTAWEQQTKAWVDEVAADKDLGGPNMAQNLAHVARARDQFLDKDTVDFLNTTGLGNHPGLLRALHRIGKAMSEDTVISGGQGAGPAAPEQVLYPTMK